MRFSAELFAATIIVCISHHFVITQEDTEAAILNSLLKNYDRTTRPHGSSGPVPVHINFFLRDMFKMEPSMQYIGAQLTFRQQWIDGRLSYDNSNGAIRYLSLSDPKRIWTPDVFFSNSKKGYLNNILVPNVLIRIYPDGSVLYSQRLTADFKCDTNSRMFPFNPLLCPILLASYGFTTKDIQFLWKEDNPIQMSKRLNLPSYEVSLVGTSDCNSKTNTGEYSCLKGLISLEREFGSIFYLLYLPPMLLVFLGWLTFFLHRRNMKTRLPLLILAVVLGSLCCANAQWQNPNHQVLSAVDVWSGICLAFVIYAMLHFVLSRHVPCVAQACGYENKDKVHHTDSTMKGVSHNEDCNPLREQRKLGSKLHATSVHIHHLVSKSGNKADIIARIFYPTAFIIVNTVYWAVYKGNTLS